MKRMMSVLDEIETWLDDAIAIETAQIDRLAHNKRVLQKVYAVRQEREAVRETIQRLEVEEERARRSRPWVHNNNGSTNNTVHTKLSDRAVPLAAYADSEPIQKGKASNSKDTTAKEDEDMSILLPKQLDDILALAQHTREGKVAPTTTAPSATTTNTASISSRKPSVPSSTVKKPINMAEKHAKYKLMTPSSKKPSTSSADKTPSSSHVTTALPQPPQQKPDIQPLAAFANQKVSGPHPPKAVDENISAILAEIEANKEYLLRAPQFAALHTFQEDIGHLGRFRISTKIKFSTLKNVQTDKLFQSQLQMLHLYQNTGHLHAWQGFASDSLGSLLALSSWPARNKYNIATNQLRDFLATNHTNPAVSDAFQRIIQQDIRRMQVLLQQTIKSGKRNTTMQVKDFILSFIQLQWWQHFLILLSSYTIAKDGNNVSFCTDFWQQEIRGTQDVMMTIFDKVDFGLLEYGSGDGEKGKNKPNSSDGWQAMENVLLQHAASLQIQVASIVKCQILSGFLRHCLAKGIVTDIYERQLLKLQTCLQTQRQHLHNDDGVTANYALARTRTLIQSEIDWIEFLKLIKFIHAIIAHDGATLSSCVFVRK